MLYDDSAVEAIDDAELDKDLGEPRGAPSLMMLLPPAGFAMSESIAPPPPAAEQTARGGPPSSLADFRAMFSRRGSGSLFGAAPAPVVDRAGGVGFGVAPAPLPGAAFGRTAALPPRFPERERSRERAGPKSYVRRVDTNIVNVDFESLAGKTVVATGDAIQCKNAECGGYMSGISCLTPSEEGVDYKWQWICEFCSTSQEVELDAQEKPKSDQKSVDYILEPAPAVVAGEGNTGGHQKAVVFAIDTSGSMCVTKQISGNLRLRGDRRADLERHLAEGDATDQRLPGQPRGVTYVSRMQSVQAAIDHQLEAMSTSDASARVGLVTFSGDVCVVGDGFAEPRFVAGDRLNDATALAQVGASCALSKPLSESRDTLVERLFALEENGPTALGPAAAVSLALISQYGAGGRIVLCTDGLANVGVGSLDGGGKAADVEAFYMGLGHEAAAKGILIDVVGIAGDGCDLETLGNMSDLTGGSVLKVEPERLAENFAGMLKSTLIASKVEVNIQLHRGLRLRNMDTPAANNTHRCTIAVGNVTADSELSFEYEALPAEVRVTMGLPADLATLPFQLQIKYTRPDGTRLLRVVTAEQMATRNRQEAERQAKPSIIASHATKQSAAMARKGAYTSSRVQMRAWSNLLDRNITAGGGSEGATVSAAVSAGFSKDMSELDTVLGRAQMQQQSMYGGEREDEDEMMTDAMEAQAEERKQSRRSDDSMAVTFQLKKRNAKGYM